MPLIVALVITERLAAELCDLLSTVSASATAGLLCSSLGSKDRLPDFASDAERAPTVGITSAAGTSLLAWGDSLTVGERPPTAGETFFAGTSLMAGLGLSSLTASMLSGAISS